MLSIAHRFHGHQSVRRVYRQGRAYRGSLMSLHVHIDERMGRGKAAVVVSKKVDKSAVRRNRIRRRIYEVVRRHQGDLTGPAGLVFTAYSADLATLPAPQLEAAVTDLLHQAKLLGHGVAASRHAKS